jgi:hypothetical protein
MMREDIHWTSIGVEQELEEIMIDNTKQLTNSIYSDTHSKMTVTGWQQLTVGSVIQLEYAGNVNSLMLIS